MYTTELTVRGSSVNELPQALYERLLGERKGSVERYDGDGFAVVVVERYYLRNNSNQQSTVVLELDGTDVCEVTIISGGGGAGLLGFDLGSESKQADEIRSEIAGICEDGAMRVEAD